MGGDRAASQAQSQEKEYVRQNRTLRKQNDQMRRSIQKQNASIREQNAANEAKAAEAPKPEAPKQTGQGGYFGAPPGAILGSEENQKAKVLGTSGSTYRAAFLGL